MKILFYSPHPHLSMHAPAGYAVHMRGVISGFKALGHEVIPLIIGDLSNNTSTQDVSKKSILFRIAKAIMPRVIWETLKDYQLIKIDQNNEQILHNFIKTHKPDLIYERINYLQVSGVRVAKQHNIPHISELNAPYIEERNELQGYSFLISKAHHINREIFEITSAIVPVSEALKRYVVEHYKINSNKITSVPNGINLDQVKVDAQKVIHIKEHYPALKDQFVLGFVGSIQKWHGVDLLIQSFQIFQKSYPNSVLMIVGDGETLEEYKKMSRDLGLYDSIIFSGNVPLEDVFNYMNVMDVLLLSNTHWYCSPIKIFEYAAIQKPMVLVKTEAVEEVFRHDQEAYLTEANPQKIAEGCLKIAQDQNYAKTLVNKAYQRLNLHFTWTKNAEKILNSLPRV